MLQVGDARLREGQIRCRGTLADTPCAFSPGIRAVPLNLFHVKRGPSRATRVAEPARRPGGPGKTSSSTAGLCQTLGAAQARRYVDRDGPVSPSPEPFTAPRFHVKRQGLSDQPRSRSKKFGPQHLFRGVGPVERVRVGLYCFSTPMMPTIRSRSSTVANSMVILPLLRPMSTFTRVSKRSESRSARSVSAGACGLARRFGSRLLRRAVRERRATPAPRWPAPTALRRRSASPAAPGPSASSRPSSARACPADRTPAATRRWTCGGQVQQPDRVGDLRPAAADPPGQLLVRRAELLEQLLVRGRLFERVQVGPVDVLQQRVPEHRVVAGVPDDRRDRAPGRAPARPASGARP